MQAFDTDARNRIIKLVKGILEQNALSAAVTPQAKLVDVGLTSLDMVNLVLSVESEFNVRIPEGAITPANFRSISAIGTLINSLSA